MEIIRCKDKVFKWFQRFRYILILSMISFIFVIFQNPRPCDDAYITFRHVNNILMHQTLSWNIVGDHVLATTSPIYCILLAIVSCVVQLYTIPLVALYVNASLFAAIVFLTYLIAEDLTEDRLSSFLVSVIIAFSSTNVYLASLGFESTLVTFATLSCLYFSRNGNIVLSLLLASLAPLIRPEGILCVIIVWGHIMVSRKFKISYLMVFFAIPIAWIAFSYASFGSPVPHSIMAKRLFPYVYRPYDGQGVTMLEHVSNIPLKLIAFLFKTGYSIIASNEFETSIASPNISIYHSLFFVISILTLLWALANYQRFGYRYLFYLWYPMMFSIFYAFVGTTEVWYLSSFYTLSIIILTTSCFRFSKHILVANVNTEISRFQVNAIVTLVFLCIFLSFIGMNQYRFNNGQRNQSEKGEGFPMIPEAGMILACDPRGHFWEWMELNRFDAYRKAAIFLNDNSDINTRTLISEVGVFGYYYNGIVIDSVGLCSPESLQFYPPPPTDVFDEKGNPYSRANNVIPTKLISDLKPTYIVSIDTYIAHLLRPTSSFTDQYEFVIHISNVFKRPVLIFKRKS